MNTYNPQNELSKKLMKKYSSVEQYQNFIEQLPEIYEFIGSLLRDPDLPQEYRPFLTGALGVLFIPRTILKDREKDLLGRVYLIGSIVRKLAQKSEHVSLIDQYWYEGAEGAQEFFSEIIREGNDSLTRPQITKLFQYGGFEARE